MRAGGGSRKGSAFERLICRVLSCWWTGDESRDDVFWRSSQSGGRATERAKKGKKTFGSYGDIAAVDPIGLPLLKYFTIELKRGRSHGSLGDLLDMPKEAAQQPFEKCLRQVQRSAREAGSVTWLLVMQRDRRQCMVYADTYTWRALGIRAPHQVKTRVGPIGALRFSSFLKWVRPDDIKKLVR